MTDIELPTDYTKLTQRQRKAVREKYVELQKGKCMYCGRPLTEEPDKSLPINWDYFPPGFLRAPVHLQHNHDTGMTEGAVHAYCNAVMWQYHGR